MVYTGASFRTSCSLTYSNNLSCKLRTYFEQQFGIATDSTVSLKILFSLDASILNRYKLCRQILSLCSLKFESSKSWSGLHQCKSILNAWSLRRIWGWSGSWSNLDVTWVMTVMLLNFWVSHVPPLRTPDSCMQNVNASIHKRSNICLSMQSAPLTAHIAAQATTLAHFTSLVTTPAPSAS